jgi:hypothetical protein
MKLPGVGLLPAFLGNGLTIHIQSSILLRDAGRLFCEGAKSGIPLVVLSMIFFCTVFLRA